MPSIALKNVAAGTSNALSGLRHEEIEPPGALITLAASGAAAGAALTYGIGSDVVMDEAEPNIEASADVVDMERDVLLDREPVQPGKQFLRTAGQISNVVVVIEQL